MVYIPLDRFDTVYQSIRKDAAAGSLASVLLFVANDVDALCSLRILSMLFKADCIIYETIPVSGYPELSSMNQLITDNAYLKNIIFINCGGIMDLTDMFSLRENINVYIIDSHRPFNLSNAFGSTQVHILDDGYLQELDDVKHSFEALEYEDSDEEEANNDQSDDSASEAEDVSVHHGSEIGEESDNSGSESDARKRPKLNDNMDNEQSKRSSIQAKRKKTREHQRVIAAYYSDGSSYGSPATSLLYTLASQLGRTENDMLWMGILGLTEQYIHDKISFSRYEESITVYREEVSRFNINDILEDDFEDGLNEEAALKSKPIDPDDRSIKFQDEFHLMLLRHWSLYDSLFHSSYVATRLGIWKDKGRQRLVNLIANTGLPLQECYQSYSSMKLEFRRDIEPKLKKWAPRYNMPEIVFPSFLRNCGYRATLSASDAVYSLTALMDCGTEWIKKHSSLTVSEEHITHAHSSSYIAHDQSTQNFTRKLTGVGSGTRTGIASFHIDPSTYEDDVYELDQEDARKTWTKNFYIAYDALSSAEILCHGVHLSIHFQKALVKTGMSILERHMVKTMKSFRFALLSESSSRSSSSRSDGSAGGLVGSGEFSVFGRSIPHLERLARFISDAYKTYQQKDLPLVMAALNDQDNSYLIIGLSGSTRGGNIRKNQFGLIFQNTAENVGARVKHDSFETSVMEIRKEDLMAFMENLKKSI